jgi:putative DNA primase/helicase
VTAVTERRRSAPEAAKDWRERLLKNQRGNASACLENALVALERAAEWQDVLHFNESSLQVIAKSMPPWDSRAVPFAWRDDDDVRTAAWMQRQGIMVGQEIAGQAIQTVAREHGFHPIRDYLNSLKWDGTKRVEDWLVSYAGVDLSAYVRAVGARWLIGAVARIYQPGCKNDACLILEGRQGTLKSTALRTLAGDDFFADDIAELGSKDAVMQTRGVWIIELAELAAMRNSESSRIKAFISRQVDRIRLPYGRRVLDAARECVFAGTVNHEAYLRDETGGRRFWPVRCGVIKINDLKRDRDQLWAEARDRYRAGEKWWLDSDELTAKAAAEQRDRYDADPWQSIVEKSICGLAYVTVEQILGTCLQKPEKDWTQTDKNRVARSLKALGCERYQQRLDDARREWRYRVSPLSPAEAMNR